MDYDRAIAGVPLAFVPARTAIGIDPNNIRNADNTHNPVWHLRRYVDGISRDILEGEEIWPGRYDLMRGEKIGMTLDAGSTDRMLYDVYVQVIDATGEAESLGYFDEMWASDLSSYCFALDEHGYLQVIAGSSPDSGWDILLATGDPFVESNLLLEALNGVTKAYLQQVSGAGYSTIAEVWVVGTPIPEPATLSLLILGGLVAIGRLTKRRR